MQENLEIIVEPLLQWYQKNKRILPWRQNKTPYSIWISEIMLQQTRIEAVKNYYIRFMGKLPNIQALANIEEEQLLKLWEGLGYYNRAKNLQKAAQQIQNQYEGKMPTTYEELKELPGIGEYTAGAIASIAYNEKVPAVDGNVLRVVSRVLASKEDVLLQQTKKKITYILKNIMPNQAGDFNEALMELGELVCMPNGEPLCSSCPLKKYCKAYQEQLIDEIPVRKKEMKRKQESKTVFILIDENDKIAIKKREDAGVLKGMYEFPNITNLHKEKDLPKLLKINWNLHPQNIEFIGEYKHVFTHIEWKMYGYKIQIKGKKKEPFLWVSKKELENKYAMPTAFKRIWLSVLDLNQRPIG